MLDSRIQVGSWFRSVGAVKLKARLLKFVVCGGIRGGCDLPSGDCVMACMGVEGCLNKGVGRVLYVMRAILN